MLSSSSSKKRNYSKGFASNAYRYAKAGYQAYKSAKEFQNRYLERSSRSKRAKKDSTLKSYDGIPRGVVENEGTGGQCSWFKRKAGKPHVDLAHIQALAPKIVNASASLQLTSPVGQQNAVVFNGNALPSTFLQVAAQPNRVYLESVKSHATIQNVRLANCSFTIYDCVARKDCGVGQIATPLTAWNVGGIDEGATSNTTYTFLGATPFAVDAFNQYWKVEQQTDVTLGAGQTHNHKVRMYPHKIVSEEYANFTNYAFRDLTYFTMIVMHGSPANDTVTQTQVSVGTATVNIVYGIEHKFKFLESKLPTLVQNTSLPQTFTTAEQVVDLGGSTITTNMLG